MRINISSTNIELTPAIKEYTENKLQALEKFMKNMDPSVVVFDVDLSRNSLHHQKGEVYKAQAKIALSGKIIIKAAENEDIRIAVDNLRDLLQRDLKKYTSQQNSVFLRGARKFKDMFKR